MLRRALPHFYNTFPESWQVGSQHKIKKIHKQVSVVENVLRCRRRKRKLVYTIIEKQFEDN